MLHFQRYNKTNIDCSVSSNGELDYTMVYCTLH